MSYDIVEITQKLIRFPSVSPEDRGCLTYIQELLRPLGFTFQRFDKNQTSNLYAKLDRGGKNICFAGHTDVVTPIDEKLWAHPPFSGTLLNEKVYGRGAVDMKGAIASYIMALLVILEKHTQHSFSMMLTSDEEADGFDGMPHILEELKKREERIDLCLVGEPTSVNVVGDTIKIGRRGSMNCTLTIYGKAGHVAYPDDAENPIPAMLELLAKIREPLDKGTEMFSPSNLEITSIDVGNHVSNVIPSCIQAKFNIRFNPLHTLDSLEHWLHQTARDLKLSYDLELKKSGEAFYGMNYGDVTPFKEKLEKIMGQEVDISTSGGTSDARHIREFCPVFELGLKSNMAHQINEFVMTGDLKKLAAIYSSIFDTFLKSA